jgi:DNA-directed RNA polymerase subunit alpha
MENFLLPSKVEFHQGETALTGALVITPCFHGYGTTLGNALRRVLLSSLSGGAVEAYKIKGTQHEFSTVEGVQEDIVEVMLNLKQLAVKVYGDESVTLNLVKKGPGPVTGADIEKNANAEVVSKDLVICNLTSNKTLEMEIIVGKGRGFVPVEEKDKKNYPLGTIVIDSVYTPVKDVGYKVEYTRVGDITNYEKLTVNIETNGTISPEDAVNQSVKILIDHFSIILSSVASTQPENVAQEPEVAVDEPVEEGEAKPKKKVSKKK